MSGGANLTRRLPAEKAFAVTPSDSTDLSYDSGKVRTRGISVTVSGNVAFKNEEGVNQLASGLSAGVIHPIAAVRILSTGTTATGITAYF